MESTKSAMLNSQSLCPRHSAEKLTAVQAAAMREPSLETEEEHQNAFHSGLAGLSNTTCVSCHVGCALQLIYHAIDTQTRIQLFRTSDLLFNIHQHLKSGNITNTATDETKDINAASSYAETSDVDYVSFLIEFSSILQSLCKNNYNNIRSEENSNVDKTSQKDTSTEAFKATTTTNIVNPTVLYEILSPILNSHETNDASTSLRILLQTLQQSITSIRALLRRKELNQAKQEKESVMLDDYLVELQTKLDGLFWSGCMVHQVSGEIEHTVTTTSIDVDVEKIVNKVKHGMKQKDRSLINGEEERDGMAQPDTTTMTRTTFMKNIKKSKTFRFKPMQKRPLSCPLILPILKPNLHQTNTSSLLEALESVIYKAQPIHGYSWDNSTNNGKNIFTEEKIETEENIPYKVVQTSTNTCSNLTSNTSSPLPPTDGDSDTIGNIMNTSAIKSVSSSSSDSSDDNNSSSSSSDDDSDDSDSSSSSYTTSSSDESDYDDAPQWDTYKHTRLTKILPKVLFFHLKRFEYHQGKVKKLSTPIDIPVILDLFSYLLEDNDTKIIRKQSNDIGDEAEEEFDNLFPKEKSCPYCYQYVLNGSIVHIDHKEDSLSNDYDGDDNDGHYINYLRICNGGQVSTTACDINDKTSGVNFDEWVKIDDHKVSPFYTANNNASSAPDTSDNPLTIKKVPTVQRNNFLQILGGSNSSDRCATVLSYVACCKCQ